MPRCGFRLGLLACCLLAWPALAQETRSAEAGKASPPARIDELAWLAGEWLVEGSAEAREAYSPPVGGVIVGHFVQADGKGGTSFYELIQIAPKGASLVYRLKHFHADLTGWEEKGDVQEFPLVAREGDSWYFDGLTIRRTPTGMLGAVLVRKRDGTTAELVFRYRRSR